MAPQKMVKNGAVRRTDMRRMVKDIVESRVEHKRGTVSDGLAALSTAGTVTGITQDVSQGDTINTRTGDMIIIDEIDLRVVFECTTAGSSNVVRYILFADLQNNGAVPAVTDVLNSANYNACYNPTNKQKNRFKILLDTCIEQVEGLHTELVSRQHHFKYGKKCFYNGSAGAASDNGKGALFFMEICRTAGASNRYEWSWELKYSDA